MDTNKKLLKPQTLAGTPGKNRGAIWIFVTHEWDQREPPMSFFTVKIDLLEAL